LGVEKTVFRSTKLYADPPNATSREKGRAATKEGMARERQGREKRGAPTPTSADGRGISSPTLRGLTKKKAPPTIRQRKKKDCIVSIQQSDGQLEMPSSCIGGTYARVLGGRGGKGRTGEGKVMIEGRSCARP